MRRLVLVASLAAGCFLGGTSSDPPPSPSPQYEPASLAASPFARLTSSQYAATLRDLFAPIAIPDPVPPPDSIVDGFDNVASGQVPSAALIAAYQASAVAVATAAMQDPAALVGCSPRTTADETACATKFLGTFGAKAYRRPLTSAELADLVAFHSSMRASGADFPTSITLTIETILEAPNFLYRIELGTPTLSPWEMASRLSYLLWNTMPDDALFAAAAAGTLATTDGIETQARRMLADPRAHAAIAHFHDQWLELGKMSTLVKDPKTFPTFTASTVTSLQQSTSKYIDDIFFGDATLTALLTDDHAFVNADLAAIYGVAVTGKTLKKVTVDPTKRAGIVTNAGMLAGFAHTTEDAPVLRGVFVLGRLLCSAPPPPPADVNTSTPAPSSNVPQTTRDRFATQHEQGTCAGCHHVIDGIGFGFEHYDAIGAWRTTDNGLPVDASGWFVTGTAGELEGTFDGAVDLAHKLAASPAVHACVARQWLRYALGTDAASIDATTLEPLVSAFEANHLNMRELVVALVKSDAFRRRSR